MTQAAPVPKIALLTAGGIAPCLSAAVGYLISDYSRIEPEAEIIGYRNGYMGLLQGQSVAITQQVRKDALTLIEHGGSPFGNSRVKLTNLADCVKRGLVQEGQNPLHVAAEQLVRDSVTILHTIGGDDTNTTAADLAAYLEDNGYHLTVVGLPKTIDNDVVPIRQTLGAVSAAEQGAVFWENAVNEQSANPRILLIHEVMGRDCGWLCAATAAEYRKRLKNQKFLVDADFSMALLDIDAIYVPEMSIDLDAEAERLGAVMGSKDCVSIFLSEGAGAGEIMAEMESRGQEVERDAFGHVRIDTINPGQWFADQFAKRLGAEKVLVQKSGYFARSARANAEDLALIEEMAAEAVRSGLAGVSGVIGHDEGRAGMPLRAIEFPRIRGGKRFDTSQGWFLAMLQEIGQLG
ncbi:MAG: pyrophosphate--fructose-6-phosphate 1-phosphotransferase [Novosphingobium sp.]|uniref:pyrophosphate--fructose-6-phosphate 1-phosphotransferase n=1 Tax=Novosphingobium sp. TaxID=1874826 RepID=UPI0032BAD029